MFSLQGFQMHAGQVFAMAGVGKAVAPVIHLVVGVSMVPGGAANLLQAGSGFLEVIVVSDELAGLDGFRDLPGGDAFFASPAALAGRHETESFVVGQGLVTIDEVGQDQRVRSFGVFEEIINALLSEQARQKVEIRLIVLNGIADFLVAVEQFLLDGKRVVGQDFVGNLHHGLVLEYLAVAGAGGVPQPGGEFGLVFGIAVDLSNLVKAGDLGVEVARAIVLGVDADGDAFT